MNILVPMSLTDAMLSSSTIAEPDTTETAWNAATNYTVGTRVIRTSTHRVYENLIAGVDATPPEDALLGTTPRWLGVGPTNRWAAFDHLVNTQSAAVTPLTYVLRPGFFNAVAFYGLDGADISVSVKDAPGGTVIFTYSGSLQEPPLDWYDWAFGQIRLLTKLVLKDIVPYPDAELTITITAATGVTVKAGFIVIGDFRPLMGDGVFGGTETGAAAEPITYSYISTDAFGTTRIKRRKSATDLRVRVFMSPEDADYALASVQEVLDVPACWIATAEQGFAGLNVFGLGSGSLSYDDGRSVLNLNVKGFI